jgi:predicted ATP-grasp superfamily ATP-dependent carboligase
VPESLLPPAGDDPRPRLLIVGCSTRAAAWSAVRAGFRPVCADQFGDEDLRQVAEVVDSASLWDLAAHQQANKVADAWMFVGGMENHPGQLRVLTNDTWRFGRGMATEPKHLNVLRRPELLQSAAEAAGIPPLEIHRQRPSSSGSDQTLWVRKNAASGGGLGIHFDQSHHFDANPAEREGGYWQEFFPGRPMSVVLLVSKATTRIVGLTEQLIGEVESAAPSSFIYCGNILPAKLPRTAGEQLRMVAESLSTAGLRGLCGMDFLWDGTSLRLLEVNPRYTAACELLEFALQRSLLTEHWRCFDEESHPPGFTKETRRDHLPGVVGKLILYARRAVTAPDLSRFLAPRSPWSVPFLADIPRIGTWFEPGQPLCTVFATGRDADAVRQKLYRRAARVRRWFGDDPS